MRLWIVLSVLWAVPMSVLGVGVVLTWHIYQPPKMVPWQSPVRNAKSNTGLPKAIPDSDVRCSHFPNANPRIVDARLRTLVGGGNS